MTNGKVQSNQFVGYRTVLSRNSQRYIIACISVNNGRKNANCTFARLLLAVGKLRSCCWCFGTFGESPLVHHHPHIFAAMSASKYILRMHEELTVSVNTVCGVFEPPDDVPNRFGKQ